MTFSLCLNSNTYHGFTLDDAIDGASAAGLELIELAAVAGYTEHVSASMDVETIQEIGARLAVRGIRAVAIGGHSALTTTAGRAAFRANLELAARLGAEYVVTGTGETHGDEEEIDDEPAFVQELTALAHHAGSLGLRIAIETHGANYPTGSAVAALVTRTGSSNVGIAYDTGNTVFYGGVQPYDDLATSFSHVIGLHLKDKVGGVGVWNFPAIGDGELDLPRLRSVLESQTTTADIPLSIEIEFTPEGPVNVQEVHDAVYRSVEVLRACGIGRSL